MNERNFLFRKNHCFFPMKFQLSNIDFNVCIFFYNSIAQILEFFPKCSSACVCDVCKHFLFVWVSPIGIWIYVIGAQAFVWILWACNVWMSACIALLTPWKWEEREREKTRRLITYPRRLGLWMRKWTEQQVKERERESPKDITNSSR